MDRLTNDQLRASYDRLADLDVRIDALQAQRQGFVARNDEQLRPLFDEKKHLLDEVAAGTPDFDAKKGHAGADAQGRPLFVVKKTERRSPDDAMYNLIVGKYPRLLALANTVKLSLVGDQAEFLRANVDEADPVNGWIVRQLNGLVEKMKLKVNRRALEKALEVGSFPVLGGDCGLTAQQADDLADCYDIHITKMVEAVIYEDSATAETTPKEQATARV